MADYAGKEELKIQVGKVGATHDVILDKLITAASATIDRFCNRPMGFLAIETATVRLYSGKGLLYTSIDDNVDVTLVEVKDGVTDATYVSWAATDWIAFSGSHQYPNFNDFPYTGLMIDPAGDYAIFTDGRLGTSRGFRLSSKSYRALPTVRVTARWGYSITIPPVVNQAAIIQAARWYSRGKSGWADTMASADFGALQFRQSLDPDVKMLLVHSRLVRASIV